MWTVDSPDTVNELLGSLNALATSPQTAFRGLPDSEWHVTSTLSREIQGRLADPDPALVNVTAKQIECFLVAEFHANAAAAMTPVELRLSETILGKIQVMRHATAPTRLVDWTRSPFIAAFFACRDEPTKDAGIWVARTAYSVDHSVEEARTPHEWYSAVSKLDAGVHFFWPRHMTPRMRAQQGLFSLSRDIEDAHCQVIHPAAAAKKIIIPSEMKSDVMSCLFGMGLTAGTLFPEITGVGELVRDLVRFSDTITVHPSLAPPELTSPRPPRGTS